MIAECKPRRALSVIAEPDVFSSSGCIKQEAHESSGVQAGR